MIVRGARQRTNFTILPNGILNDQRLSWRARGLLAYLLSKPDNWRTTIAHLTKQGTEGRDAVTRAMTELEHTGYLVRRRWQDKHGHWHHDILVHDEPVVDNPVDKPASYPQTDS
jgi:hypothetical protein